MKRAKFIKNCNLKIRMDGAKVQHIEREREGARPVQSNK